MMVYVCVCVCVTIGAVCGQDRSHCLAFTVISHGVSPKSPLSL
jgi:hypothetical protein